MAQSTTCDPPQRVLTVPFLHEAVQHNEPHCAPPPTPVVFPGSFEIVEQYNDNNETYYHIRRQLRMPLIRHEEGVESWFEGYQISLTEISKSATGIDLLFAWQKRLLS
ncbi:hypothetical protein KXW16_006775 [Aspergillus fumigatus]|nr:hypothetical protein KXW16_006775 [Aspergillus fumigatus]